MWTGRFSLPNSKSGISKQKALSKFEAFILEYDDLELVTIVVWKDQDIGRCCIMRFAFFNVTFGVDFVSL